MLLQRHKTHDYRTHMEFLFEMTTLECMF